jgi:hypothetical protein
MKREEPHLEDELLSLGTHMQKTERIDPKTEYRVVDRQFDITDGSEDFRNEFQTLIDHQLICQ